MKYLLCLYPKAWRERYGEEFEALLEQRTGRPSDVLDIILGGVDARLHPPARTASGTSRRKGTQMALDRTELRQQLQAVMAAHVELGEDGEQQLVEHFLDMVEDRAALAQMHQRGRGPHLPALSAWRWVLGAVALWVLMGMSSVAIGFPWMLHSTAPAQVFAASVISGYALVLGVLLFALLVTSAFRLGSKLAPRASHAR